MRGAYYNELDQQKAAWLRELMRRGLIAEGDVDERSIADVSADDVRGYVQCHWFAGVGIWSYALRLAGWPDDRPIWTASCPCQPFSAAGKGEGVRDPRHLWPNLFALISARRPECVIGEQVSSADGLAWFDLVQADMGCARYTCGGIDTCAAGVGAPHIRQRLYWAARLADVQRAGFPLGHGEPGDRGQARETCGRTQRLGDLGGLADARCARLEERPSEPGDARGQRAATVGDCGSGRLEHDTRDGREQRRPEPSGGSAERGCGAVRVGDDHGERCDGERVSILKGRSQQAGAEAGRPGPVNGAWAGADHGGVGDDTQREGGPRHRQSGSSRGQQEQAGGSSVPGPVNGYWRGADWVLTRPQRVGDAPSLRPVESTPGPLDDGAAPGMVRGGYSRFPLAQGEEARVLRLKGYGDGIVSQQAAAFVQACAEEWGL